MKNLLSVFSLVFNIDASFAESTPIHHHMTVSHTGTHSTTMMLAIQDMTDNVVNLNSIAMANSSPVMSILNKSSALFDCIQIQLPDGTVRYHSVIRPAQLRASASPLLQYDLWPKD
jgi:protein-tyrosine phosphatase